MPEFKLQICATIAVAICPIPALASNQDASRVTLVAADNFGGPQAFVATGGARTAKPACATDDMWAISDPSSDNAKAIYSTVLTLFAANREILVYGTGNCDPASPTRETVAWINAK